MSNLNVTAILNSGLYAPPGVKPKLHNNEQNPHTFDPTTSRYLPPLGVDPTGKPFYHVPNDGSGFDPYNRDNHIRTSYRMYKDAKDAAANSGAFPVWLWVVGGVAAVALAFMVANK